MLGLLTSPGETFKKVVGKGGWACLAPFIILIVFGMVSGMVFTHRVNMEEFIRQQMLKGPHASEMSETQIDQRRPDGRQVRQGGHLRRLSS